MPEVELPDDELDIETRAARDVAARAIVLATVLRRISLDGPGNSGDTAEEAFDLREWLRDQQLLADLVPRELALLERPVDSLPESEVGSCTWQAAALAVLAWALHIIDLPPVDSGHDVPAALAAIPTPWDATSGFIAAARLRPDDEIIAERERAEIWLWRATAEALRRDAPGVVDELAATIAEVVAEAAAAGLIQDTADGDFALGGLPVHDVTPEALDALQMIAAERLRALNWICGFGNSWDDVPLDV